MKKKTKNIIKVAIVFLMAGAIALSALAPIFASEGNNNEDRMSSLRKVMAEIRGEKVDTADQEIEQKREEIRQRRGALRQKILSIKSNLDNILNEFHSTPDTRERRVTARGIPSGFSFQYDLRERAKGEAVRYLQIILNLDPATRVANFGVGSPGRETTLFGENTRSALIRFQRKYGISPTGFFGLQSRAKANEILRSGIIIKEKVEKDISTIKEDLLDVMDTIKEAREEIELINEEELKIEGKEISFDYKKDIEDAQNYAKEQMICTMEIREMRRNAESYLARNGCEISFLERRGWE